MPLKLDDLDMMILRSLLRDGRRSYRSIAGELGVSTPTVRSRVAKMIDSGVIKGFSPILDLDRISEAVSALVFIKADLSLLDEVASKLSGFDEVKSVFITSGESNLVIRVVAPSNEAIQGFLTRSLAGIDGISVVTSQVIMRTVKEEYGLPLVSGLHVRVKCDTCGREVEGEPLILEVKGGKRFFCCKLCLSSYRERYGV